ncbi:hypothetical protein HF086_017272 [Spodoptera exigua]|uniref:Uncharacterized protein n=1 Tax=Spodoptera exigua TaxID=7107 RepID=A0A922M0K4_SPOEX|nr:hypothetical protein HF086_017272 [Spodoptera exigua]
MVSLRDRFFRTLQTESKLKENRYKRSFYNDTVDDNYVSVVNDTDDRTNLTKTTDEIETITDNLKIISLVNDTADRLLLNEKKSTDDLDAQTRRAIPALEYQPQSRIKGKLLSYLEETFDEIDRKIKPLTNIKIALSNNNEYRIGYIIATIDTMQVNLKKWKENTRVNQHKWNDEKILDVFDRIKATNKVTTNLIETLKRHLSEGKETKVFKK